MAAGESVPVEDASLLAVVRSEVKSSGSCSCENADVRPGVRGTNVQCCRPRDTVHIRDRRDGKAAPTQTRASDESSHRAAAHDSNAAACFPTNVRNSLCVGVSSERPPAPFKSSGGPGDAAAATQSEGVSSARPQKGGLVVFSPR
ncbi:unnamed protein product [Pleuronectes platessa]|uniref:Uncharacterized protein n=1 Tax=Pleuronectes platessa TaxID=8262 RepID=A0A9N7TM58_PLEPL|nr:unnamed protein product [Pleuronectes platessa]